ncbi:MAG: hypothetical protein P8R54_18930 [Myxococcota bacterium]|nr:hypothetical protein [Myxococcota bacterium]
MSFVPLQSGPTSFSDSLLPPESEPTADVNPTRDDADSGEPSGPSPAEIEALIAAAEVRGAAQVHAEVAEERAQLTARASELEALLVHVEETRRSDRSETRQLIGSLIISSMRRLIGEHPLLREAALRHAFAQAVASMVGDRDVVLWVAPGQEAIARELIDEREGWSVRVSTELHAGMQVVGPRGRLDSSLMTAIIAMESAVDAWLEERP